MATTVHKRKQNKQYKFYGAIISVAPFSFLLYYKNDFFEKMCEIFI